MDRLLKKLQVIWNECKMPPFELISASDHRYLIRVDRIQCELMNVFWVRVVTRLCEDGQLTSLRDAPMQLGERTCSLWLGDTVCTFVDDDTSNCKIRPPERQRIDEPFALGIGGPSGAGKTSVIRQLHNTNQIITIPAYTTRLPRKGERNGVDYYFVDNATALHARTDLRYSDFREARGHWYWTEPALLFRAVWSTPSKTIIFTLSRESEMLCLRKLFPGLRWIWLDASASEVMRRLERRGDMGIDRSMEYNREIAQEKNSKYISLVIQTDGKRVENIVDEIKQYCEVVKTS